MLREDPDFPWVQGLDDFLRQMPDYQFFITEGAQTQEILLGVRRTFPAFFTQKTEFQSGQSTLRPGVLLTLKAKGRLYSLLFLHLKSLTDPKGFGLRDDMTERALRFRATLDEAARRADGPAARANYLFLGDLNTMGMNLTYSPRDVPACDEIQRLKTRAKACGMRLLQKTHEATYWPGSRSSLSPGDLDHVVVSEHVQIKGEQAEVRGWVEKRSASGKDAWVKRYSDHGMIWVEVG